MNKETMIALAGVCTVLFIIDAIDNKFSKEQELEYYKNYYKKMQAFIKYYNDDRMRKEWEEFNNMFNRSEGLA